MTLKDGLTWRNLVPLGASLALLLGTTTASSQALGSLARARDNLSSSLASSWKSARPVTTRSELRRHLSLPSARLNSIGVGSLPATTAVASRNGFWCSGGSCICFGDGDCNDMYSSVCRSPSTGGMCRIIGSSVICTCSIRRG